MLKRYPSMRFLWPVVLTSLVLIGLCACGAVFVLRQQASATESLRENLVKRRAAGDLKESLIELAALLRNHDENVQVIQQRSLEHLDQIAKFAAKSPNRDLVERLRASFEQYRELWKKIRMSGRDRDDRFDEAAAFLDSDTKVLCEQLVGANEREMNLSYEDHHRAMRWLAWGLGGVGVLGTVAGSLFGYGVARGLSRTIRRLQIRLQDAAGKIGPDLPEIVFTGEGDLGRLEGQMQELMDRCEQLVAKLQMRERGVLRAEQLAAVGQLAAGVAHEIRNPLTSIKMLVQVGREESAGLSAEDLEVIEREALRMERSLQVFLDFARLPKPERRQEDLGAIAAQTVNLIRGRAAKQHVELHLSSPDSPILLEVDGEQIHQVLVNLCLNALDVMPSGGRLEMIVKPCDGHVDVSVLDTGPGIAAELMPRLFEPFVSTKETGLGLGLVISRRIVDEHNGQLSASNRFTGGACFTLQLPFSKP